MTGEVEIQAVGAGDQMRALEFLLAGDARDALTSARAEELRRLVRRRAGAGAELLWARRGDKCLAAAMVMKNPGRVGMLLHSPPSAAGVDREALAAVIRTASREALAEDLVLVQTLVDQGSTDCPALLKSAGFSLLATLVYMRLSPLSRCESPAAGLQWRSGDQYDQRELERVIAQTYNGSLDCPALTGVRTIADVIECHKASGIYRPQSWWIVHLGRMAAGCILMNDSAVPQTAEIVYLGVVPACRGRGLGRAMLRHAAADARSRGLRAIELAVDDANAYAMRLYESEGFRAARRQWAYVMFRDGAKTAAGPRDIAIC